MMAVGLTLGLAVVYAVHRSLEEFPTEEQHHKVRLVAAFGAAALALVEVGLWSLLRRLGRAAPAPGHTVDRAAPPAA